MSLPILSILAVLFLVALSAVFATAETAITAASKARIHRLGQIMKKSRLAQRVSKMLDRRDELVSSILLGSTFINNLATALTTYLLVTAFGQASIFYATIAVTILLLIFAEALPKILGIARAERLALRLTPLADLLRIFFGPFINLVLRMIRGFLHLVGVDLKEKQLSGSDEIRGAIGVQVEEGHLIKEDKDMLGSILDLDHVPVGNVMIHRKQIHMIDIDQKPGEIIREIVRSTFSRIPLYRNNPDNVVGVISTKDCLRALARKNARMETLNIERLMTKPWFVPETTSLRAQLEAFMSRHAHFALIVDEYGDLQGLLTLEDILEEIVGQIEDEYDEPDPEGVTVDADGSIVVDGVVTLRDLNRRFGWSFPAGAATIAGLLIEEARIIPVKGQSFTFHGFQFDVLERRRNQITKIRLSKISSVT